MPRLARLVTLVVSLDEVRDIFLNEDSIDSKTDRPLDEDGKLRKTEINTKENF